MPDVFVTANVLLHAFDEKDLSKQQRAREWLTVCWQRRCGRLSTQVLDAFYANARKRFASAISAGDARAEVRRYQLWKPWAIDQATVETAWAIESRDQLDYADALMVAAARHMGCAYLLTEDLPHEAPIDRVRVLNPFLVGPGILDQPVIERP
jgi:predicted nucleic acid-binding protein